VAADPRRAAAQPHSGPGEIVPEGPGGDPARLHDLARLYDLDMADETADVELYLALARAAEGPLLELAAGSGRICVPLAAAGHDVVGVDNDPQMLARARSAWEAVGGGQGEAGGALSLIQADLTTLDLGRRFELVILALNSLLMLPGRTAQRSALEAIARHLAPSGRAVVDVVLPSPDDLALYDGRIELAWQRLDEPVGRQVAKLWSARYEPAAAVARITTQYDSWPTDGGPVQRLSRTDEMHLIGAHELIALAEQAGLRPDNVAGDFEMTPLAPDSQRIVLVAGLL
jgi:SAM-dependent methyltransferase